MSSPAAVGIGMLVGGGAALGVGVGLQIASNNAVRLEEITYPRGDIEAPDWRYHGFVQKRFAELIGEPSADGVATLRVTDDGSANAGVHVTVQDWPEDLRPDYVEVRDDWGRVRLGKAATKIPDDIRQERIDRMRRITDGVAIAGGVIAAAGMGVGWLTRTPAGPGSAGLALGLAGVGLMLGGAIGANPLPAR